jgi:hypothetical protein
VIIFGGSIRSAGTAELGADDRAHAAEQSATILPIAIHA